MHGWSREYFEQHLVGLEAAGVTILPGIELEGDAEVGMRKSKLVTIYDEKITIKWKATDSTGINLTGTLVALSVLLLSLHHPSPRFMHHSGLV